MDHHYFEWVRVHRLYEWPFSNSYGLNYQRVAAIKSHSTIIFLWFSYGFPHILQLGIKATLGSEDLRSRCRFFLQDSGRLAVLRQKLPQEALHFGMVEETWTMDGWMEGWMDPLGDPVSSEGWFIGCFFLDNVLQCTDIPMVFNKGAGFLTYSRDRNH